MTGKEALRVAYSKRKDSAGEERDFLNTIIKALEQEPKTGQWSESTYFHYYVCSECEEGFSVRWKHCPNCGAKMGVEEDG